MIPYGKISTYAEKQTKNRAYINEEQIPQKQNKY
jgi:hypothetical protein